VKILHVHAHFDDFEFVAAGTFELWRRKLGAELHARVLVCTDGKAGHHFRSREETMCLRLEEQEASARFGQYEFRLLRLPNGEVPRDGCLLVTTPLLAALWKEIREFQPDYIFAPPYPSDPLAGIHVDHVAVSEAIRKVAYMINVPHAFLPEFPNDEIKNDPVKVPVILTVHDSYMAGENAFDLAADVEDAFDAICEMTWCHQSQITEWIPWVGRHEMEAPQSMEDWKKTLRRRFVKRNREMGLPFERIHEFFTVTAWGEIPNETQISKDFPNLNRAFSHLEDLRVRLNRWRGDT
jgi:LmbE family N-acetylglucosaminyl deacetylase